MKQAQTPDFWLFSYISIHFVGFYCTLFPTFPDSVSLFIDKFLRKFLRKFFDCFTLRINALQWFLIEQMFILLRHETQKFKPMEIKESTPVAMLTVGQLRDFLGIARQDDRPREPPKNEEKRLVYGLQGIQRLFNVSHVTAQRYKDTFLAPAVRQQGRKIVVDVEKALQLFSEYSNQK